MTAVQWLCRLLYPPKCPLCGQVTAGYTPRLCPDCAREVEPEWQISCPLCHSEAPDCRCRTSLPPSVGELGHLAPGFYRPGHPNAALSRLVFTLKHDSDETSAHIFATEMSRVLLRHFLAAGEDCGTWHFTYAPRTRRARFTEGVDQAKRLARLCAERCGGSFEDLFLRRGGREQKTLGEAERRANAAHSLYLKRNAEIRGKKFVLIDDILTTGATLSACTELLTEAGAEAVFCLTALKTLPHREKKETSANDGPLWFQM